MKVIKYKCDSCGQWFDEAGLVTVPGKEFDFCLACLTAIIESMGDVMDKLRTLK